jgi:hypothetical protein
VDFQSSHYNSDFPLDISSRRFSIASVFRKKAIGNLMEKRLGILAGMVFVLGLIFILHAQETAATVQGGAASTADWQTASDLAVMLTAIEQTEPVPADAITKNPGMGVAYWSAQHAPGTAQEWPPLPDPNMGVSSRNFSLWPLGDNQFLIDDLGYNYSAKKTRTTSLTSQTITLDDGVPGAPGGDDTNDDDDTNYYGGVNFSPMPITTNDLWLQMVCVTNQTANLIIHPPWNVTNGVYDLWYCTNWPCLEMVDSVGVTHEPCFS